MEIFICGNVYMPLRSGPTHKSEMLSQILFGEKYTVLDSCGTWLRIKDEFDGFSGWVETEHIEFTDDTGNTDNHVLNRSLLCFREDNTRLVLEAGCEIYSPDFREKTFMAGKNIFRTDPEFNANFVSGEYHLQDVAMKFINAPFLLGGRVPSGIDGSGFSQLVFKIGGIKIPREVALQANEGVSIEFIDEAIPGDLAFFGEEKDKITHAGMIVAKGLVIHSYGRVRIDPIDHQGIFRFETGDYSHTLRLIRRISTYL
jgi:gamma-D-glutamyl-L-lysine dipeptidyl-peptidase